LTVRYGTRVAREQGIGIAFPSKHCQYGHGFSFGRIGRPSPVPAVLRDDLCRLGLVVRQLGDGPGSSRLTTCLAGKGCQPWAAVR
jgi:hypothetical protein